MGDRELEKRALARGWKAEEKAIRCEGTTAPYIGVAEPWTATQLERVST